MKLLTRDTDYAVRAICHMAKMGQEVVSVNELVEKLRMPRPFLRKILQKLNKNGLARSYKGTGGGFALAVHPDKIYLEELIQVFQGPFKINECVFKKKLCPSRGTCPLKKRIDLIERRMKDDISSITIGSLLRGT